MKKIVLNNVLETSVRSNIMRSVEEHCRCLLAELFHVRMGNTVIVPVLVKLLGRKKSKTAKT